MNNRTIPTRKVKSIEQEGDFCFSEDFDYIYVWLPGCTGPDAIRIERGPDTGRQRVWGWDGDEEKPTLTPSIDYPDVGHGYLTGGILRSC